MADTVSLPLLWIRFESTVGPRRCPDGEKLKLFAGIFWSRFKGLESDTSLLSPDDYVASPQIPELLAPSTVVMGIAASVAQVEFW